MRLFPRRSAGADYYAVIRRLHAFLQPRTYVEIGVRQGESFALAKTAGHSVAIDPAPDLQIPLPSGAKLFKMTSDDFFARHDLRAELNGNLADLAFIDGMHVFEFALRDFINLEKHCGPASTILIHDGYPQDAVSAARERTTQIWSGDVWKLLLCLKKYRPDLRLSTIDVPPTRLTIVRNLDRSSTLLSANLEKLCAKFVPMQFETISANKAVQLNRIENDWRDIQELFPERETPSPFARWRSRIKTSHIPAVPNRSAVSKPKVLGVLLCYNDADVLPDAIEALLNNNHELVVWDHGSSDATASVLDRYSRYCIERRFIPRSFDFYRLHGEMSKNLLQNHCAHFDWISWPDQDEILEGPQRDRSYYEYLTEVFNSEFDWVQFRNFNFWFTDEDDSTIGSPAQRIRRYCLFPDCAPRIRAWRSSVTNLRQFNHNPPAGRKYPVDFNLRHYPMRTHQQMLDRLNKDRAGLERNGMNYHYNNMKQHPDKLTLAASSLHLDNGRSALNPEVIFNWRAIYGQQTAGNANSPAAQLSSKK